MCDHILSFNPREDSEVRCGVCHEVWYKVPRVWVADELTDSITICPDDCTVHSDSCFGVRGEITEKFDSPYCDKCHCFHWHKGVNYMDTVAAGNTSEASQNPNIDVL